MSNSLKLRLGWLSLFSALMVGHPMLMGQASGSKTVDRRSLCTFDGRKEEGLRIQGEHKTTRHPPFVVQGDGALELVLGPTQDYPGLYLKTDRLQAREWKTLALEVLNPTADPIKLSLRLDDAQSRSEPQRYRSSRTLTAGWNSLKIDLTNLVTVGGNRKLAPGRLNYFIAYLHRPKVEHRLVFDNLRFERPARADSADAKKQRLKAFVRAYVMADNAPGRVRAVQSLSGVDSKAAVSSLVRRVLTKDDDARVLRAAQHVLSEIRSPDSIQRALDLVDGLKGSTKWRLIRAIGAIESPKTYKALTKMASSSVEVSDQIAALRALEKEDAPALFPLLEFSDDQASWQLHAAKLAGLKASKRFDAFPAIAKFLKSAHARQRSDAQALLTAMSGRDLGEAVGPWLAWYQAQVERKAQGAQPASEVPRAAYGTYYGIPIYPGRLCFIIDVSGSMSAPLSSEMQAFAKKRPHLRGKELNSRLDLAKEEARHAIAELDEKTYFQLIHYQSEALAWSRKGMKRATKANKRSALKRLDSLRAGGGTNLHGALSRAFEEPQRSAFSKQWSEGPDTIYILSDGIPTEGLIKDSGHLATDIEDRNLVRMIKINSISLGAENNALLARLAEQSGGVMKEVKP